MNELATTPQGFQPPQSNVAESALLGCLMISSDFGLVHAMLCADDFAADTHRAIFSAMAALFEKHEPIDTLTVIAELARTQRLDLCGGEEYVVGLVMSVPNVDHTEHYAKMVSGKAQERKLLLSASLIASIALDHEDNKLERANVALLQCFGNVGKSMIPVKELVTTMKVEARAAQESPRTMIGLNTGFPDLNRYFSGLQVGLHVITARPSMGKTSFALAMFRKMSVLGLRPMFITLEMKELQLGGRLASYESGFAQDEIRTGYISSATPWRGWNSEECQRLDRAYDKLTEDEAYILYASQQSSHHICTTVQKAVLQKRVGVVFVDYIQLLKEQKSERRDIELGEACRNLLVLANEQGIPVVAMSQLNRGVDGRDNKVPTMSDLKDSGGIEEAADTIIALYRQDYYDSQNAALRLKGWSPDNQMQGFVLKDRLNGSTGEMLELVRVPHSGAIESKYRG